VPDDVTQQCRLALDIISDALADAGSSFAKAVRVTYMLPDATDFEPCWPILRAAFGENPPVATMIECGLIDRKYRIEIEVTALAG
jgi:enamine deaminase RidA (YjgF/YER057c/UK114 family)